MPYDFEDNYEQDEYEQQDEYEAPAARPHDPIQERLQLASAYQALLERGIFADGTPATDKVEKEVQAFVRERLEVLVGYRSETPKATQAFSDEEIAILKAFAVRIKTQQSAPVPATPTVKTPEPVKPTPPAPTVKPAVAPKPPTVRTPKPRPAPKPRKPREAPPKAPVETFTYDKGRKYPSPRSKEEAELIPDTEVFKVGPRFYMWRTNELGLRYRVNVTPQAGQSKANDLYTPMPTGTMFTAISAQQAENQAKQGKNALEMGGREHSHALE